VNLAAYLSNQRKICAAELSTHKYTERRSQSRDSREGQFTVGIHPDNLFRLCQYKTEDCRDTQSVQLEKKPVTVHSLTDYAMTQDILSIYLNFEK